MRGVRAFRDALAAPKNKGVTNIAHGSDAIEPGLSMFPNWGTIKAGGFKPWRKPT